MTVRMMGFKEKLDVLDFIINILREHERSLDNLVVRLEFLFQELERRGIRKFDPVSLGIQEILHDVLGDPIIERAEFQNM